MKKEEEVHISKFLALALRHKPETIGLSLDSNGWAVVYDLISKMNEHDHTLQLDFDKLQYVVEHNEKKRFAFNANCTQIRANQRHSIKDVDLELEEIEPPVILFHGTSKDKLDIIKKEGINRMSRQYVHLTSDYETAIRTGQRHGSPTVIMVQAQAMWEQGCKFYLSDNGVWLTEIVPPNFLLA